MRYKTPSLINLHAIDSHAGFDCSPGGTANGHYFCVDGSFAFVIAPDPSYCFDGGAQASACALGTTPAAGLDYCRQGTG